MIAVFIDPGPESSGWCWVRLQGRDWNTVQVRKGDLPREHFDSRLDEAVFPSDPGDEPLRIGAERMVCYGPRSLGEETLDAAHWGGIALATMKIALRTYNATFFRPSRPEVLKHTTGRSNASKPEINQCLYARFGGKGTIKKPGLLYGMDQHQRDAFAGCVWLLEVPDKVDFNDYQKRG